MTRLPPLTPNASLRWDVVAAEIARVAGPGGGLGDVLEIGVGQGAAGARLASRSHYVGTELDASSLSVARPRIMAAAPGATVLQGLTDDVLAADERFDWVCAFEVLEHLADDTAAISDWARRLRPGGRLLLSVPAFAHRYGPSDRMVGHFRRYDPAVLRALLVDAGLTDVRLTCYGVPLGYVLDGARNAIGRRRGFPPTPDGLDSHGQNDPDRRPEPPAASAVADMQTSTLGSGRLFQPGDSLGPVIAAATWPFRRAQRRFPQRGTGLVAVARAA